MAKVSGALDPLEPWTPHGRLTAPACPQFLDYPLLWHLKIQLGNARLTIDELATILLEIQQILFNRRVMYEYPSHLDNSITPNNLLVEGWTP